MSPQTTFTKFDALGSVLSELSFDCIDLQFHRYSTGHDGFSVTLHEGDVCKIGSGDTPSDALSMALQLMAAVTSAKIEAKAAELAA